MSAPAAAATQNSCTSISISSVCASAGRAEASITRLARPTAIWRVGQQFLDEHVGGVLELGRRDDAVDEADALSASGAPIVRAVMIISLARPRPTTAGRRVDPPTSGMIPNFTSGSPSWASLSATRRSHAEGHLQRAAEARPVDLADDRLGHLFAQVRAVQEHLPEGAQHRHVARRLGQLTEVHAGREDGSFAAQHHAVDVLGGGGFAQRPAEREQQLAVHRVALLGAVQDHVADRAAVLGEDDAHGWSS